MKPLMRLLLVLYLLAWTNPLPQGRAFAATSAQPLSPEALLQRVLTRNPALLAAQESLAAAQAEQKSLEALLLPMISVNGQYTAGTTERMSQPIPDVEPQNMSMRPAGVSAHMNLTTLYPLFTGGKFQAQIEAAKRRVEQAEAAYSLQKLEVLTQTRQSLLSLRWQMARAELFEAEQARQKADLDLAQHKLELGKIPRYMVLRSQSELVRLEQAFNLAHLEIHHQLTELGRLAALAQTAEPQIQAVPLSLPTRLPVLPAAAEAQRRAIAQSPRLRALRAQLAEAETRVQIARSHYYPFIYLAGSLDFGTGYAPGDAELQQHGLNSPAASGVAVDLLITLPVFDGWKRDAELERFQHEAGSLLNQYTDARNRLQADVTRQLLEMEAMSSNLTLSAQLVEQQNEELRITQLRFKDGKAIQLELLDALNQWRSARLNQLENWYQFERARLSFEQLLALEETISERDDADVIWP